MADAFEDFAALRKPAATSEAEATVFGSPTPAAAVRSTAESNPAKHLDFGGGQAPPTPQTPVPFQGTSSSDIDYNQFVLDTLLWKNKVRSAFYFLAGLVQAVLINKVFASKTPIISGLCFVLLVNLGINFLRSLVTSRPSATAQWSGSSLTRNAVYLFTEGVNAASAVLDKHLSGSNPSSTLLVAVGLWFLSMVARAVSAFNLMLALHVAAFTVPLAYSLFKSKVDGSLHQAWGVVSGQFAQLDRLPKVGAVAVPTLVLALLLSKVDLLIAVLVICIFLRTLLAPAEVDGFSRKVVDPVTKAMTGAGKTLYTFAGDAATRFDLTPTPSKKKAL